MKRLFVFVMFLQAMELSASVTWAPRVSGDMSWVDRAQRPGIKKGVQERSLGLTRLELSLYVEHHMDWAFNATFRPDVLSNNESFDSRAGKVYKKSEDVDFLDTYSLHYFLSENAELAYGVWEDLSVGDIPSYNPVVFGLLTQLPTRFSGARVQWGGTIDGYGNWKIRMYSIAGHNDRANSFARSESAVDSAPQMKDPHWGGALGSYWIPNSDLKFSTLLGWITTTEKLESDKEKVEETLLKLNALYRLMPDISGCLEFRYVKENFLKQPTVDVVQSSLLASSWWDYSSRSRVHLTFTWGKSDNREKVSDTGHQLAIGYLYKIAQGLDLNYVMTQETRKLGEPFAYGDRNMIRRLGVQLRWNLDSQSYSLDSAGA